MDGNKNIIERIVKTALLDEGMDSEAIITLMKANNLSSGHLLNYIAEDAFWSTHQPDESFTISPQDEKYIIDFKNPSRKQEMNALREELREAVHTRFYTGHRFNEWKI